MRPGRTGLLVGPVAAVGLAAMLSACGQPPAEVGQCAHWEQLGRAERDGIETVACEEEHDAQFVGQFEVEFDEFPGQGAIDAEAEPGCLAAFESFIGTEYADSELRLDWFRPTQQSWEQTGGQDVLCVAYLPEGTATGSFEATGR